MKFIIVVFSALLLSACSANSLKAGAGQVRITHNEPGKACSWLGDVTGSQGNFFTGGWTSNSNLETGARNDLKNQAWEMGGNLVVLLTQRAGQTGSAYQGSGSSQQTNVTLSGSVYRCP
ncbi:DUF4156 domain-containing protein [Citrobacter rodentium]|jgi:hypothetical protein|uniref:Lipoprotein n=2 Tax=Citrobacter rodentium TaxID=67825 RepID=D2TJM8_CITRI|nr:DUF4156 domain-containing protein [Citrobacter rodentium]KIQ53237.1 lipoprotein [Citrobacter rodentium]QBY29381.1 DUF4156 domain-containing protein [Citrobacter rodentium]UHO33217.1 DUF4156 domain-containing protein [Citrobacter rodentium NBRC 105723 = DSM 16636]CBG89666.1 putative lipoprotein [Citrobacter rodentium ICC168]HAT8015144.1 DUF4156 domain-containing protein [Citrobacter rodentium NBRC 105723 = DSM 16636]